MGSEDEYIKATTLENELEAWLSDSILKERDIPHRLKLYFDTAYDGLFQAQKGSGYVRLPCPHREEILEIIADLRNEAR